MELTDEEVFGKAELSDDEVFGAKPAPQPSVKDRLYKSLNAIFQPGSVVNPAAPGKSGFNPDGVVSRVLEQNAQPNNLQSGARIVDGVSGVAEVGARKGYAGIGRIEAGAIKALADVLGSDTLSSIAASQQARANEVERGAVLRGQPIEGFSNESIVQDVPEAATNAISSVIQSASAIFFRMRTICDLVNGFWSYGIGF